MIRRVLAALLAITLAPLGARATAGYSAGAKAVVITPPRTGARVGSDVCPMSVFTGPSIWDFDEPYIDLNGNGRYDLGEPYCDRNVNGRYDGIWVVGQADHHAERVNDDLYVRTFVVSDGSRAVALASVDSLGLFDTDVAVARKLVVAVHPELVDLFVSADHNESAPDSVGLWGPGAPLVTDQAGIGAVAGVNDYYMDFLARKIADSVDQAFASMKPASLSVLETTTPTIIPTLNHWPTTNRKDGTSAIPDPHTAGRIDAWDPKVRILQARDEIGATIFTVVGYDAHVQNLGHSSDPAWSNTITADWPGFLWRDVEAVQGGVAIFLQGAVGSIETPQVPSRHNAAEGTIERSQDIGKELAAVVNAAIPGATALLFGPVDARRDVFAIPLENQLFLLAFAAHLFPHKLLAVPPIPPGSDRPYLQTEVGVMKIGPIELLANPGEAFPSLTKGSHWGIDEGCSVRANPPVPAWASSAAYRWDVGLANDMIGYESPAWGWDAAQETYVDPTDSCSIGLTSAGNHAHGLEDESTGPSGANLVAQHLFDLVTSVDGASANAIVTGRYLFADGTMSRRPYTMPFASGGIVPVSTRAVGMVFGSGEVAALPGYSQLGSSTVDQTGTFIDFDGHAQSEADDTTRGMLIGGRATFLDVYPAWP